MHVAATRSVLYKTRHCEKPGQFELNELRNIKIYNKYIIIFVSDVSGISPRGGPRMQA